MPATLALISIAITSWLYFTGWMYLYYYLRSFGFSIFEVDVPFHYFFIYAFAVLDTPTERAFGVLLALVIFAFAYFFVRHAMTKSVGMSRVREGQKLRRFFAAGALDTRIALTVIGVAGTILLFLHTHHVARAGALAEADNLRVNAAPRIVLLEDSTEKELGRFSKFARSVDISEFLIQQGSDRSWKEYTVSVVFADKSRYFLYLRHSRMTSGTAISLDKKRVVLIGDVK